MITLGGDAELELVDSLDPFSEGIVFRSVADTTFWLKRYYKKIIWSDSELNANSKRMKRKSNDVNKVLKKNLLLDVK